MTRLFIKVGKRALDFMLVIPGLILLMPLIGLTAMLVRIKLGRPVLFLQQRPGLHGKPFTILKFRTMTDERDSDGKLLPDARRLCRFGRFLRKTSLDELPELWNVLKGDMSLVGPRPLLNRYMPYFTEREKLRFTVKPGITGWAQVHGRNESSWDKRFEDDVWYVENRKLSLDIAILALTLKEAFVGKGVVPDARSIMLNLDEERAVFLKEKL